VAIVRSGRIAYQGSLAELRAQAGESYLLRSSDEERARAVAAAQPGIEEVVASADGTRFGARDEGAVGALSLALAEAGAPILELSRRHATLEDLFFSLTEGDTTVETRRVDQDGGDPERAKVETA
jgi:ABC-2 type transport system ATP-binding protein